MLRLGEVSRNLRFVVIANNRLMGIYFQAALGQQFDVVFERIK